MYPKVNKAANEMLMMVYFDMYLDQRFIKIYQILTRIKRLTDIDNNNF